MLKIRMLLILGIWITILPYLGFPYSWKDVLYTISGAIIIYISYKLYKDYKKNIKKEKIFDNFKENDNFNQDQIIETITGEEQKF